jgi:tagatose 6-phosphate kinase
MILCVGLNPVYQKTLTVEDFRIDRVNRVNPGILESSAGKGINVARTIKTLGRESLVTGFLGGDTGRYVQGFLAEEGLESDFVTVSSPTRTCTTILDPQQHTHTEIVEEGRPVSADEVERMRQLYTRRLSSCQCVTISGTAPQQVPSDIYADFIRAARQFNIPVLLDTQKELLLHSLDAAPFLLKINQDELGAAFHEQISSSEILFRLIDRVHEQGVECVLISHGKEALVLSHAGERRRIVPPSIRAVNPIGSGDAVLGGLASALCEGKDFVDAARLGTACGAANALTLSPGVVRLEDVMRFETEIHVDSYS